MTTDQGINKGDEDADGREDAEEDANQRREGSDEEEEEDANGNRTRIVRSDEPFRPDGSGNGREEWTECIKKWWTRMA